MITLRGRAICDGVAIGKAMVYRREDSIIKRYHVDSIESEIERFEAARTQAIDELSNLYERTAADVGEDSAEIFGIHRQMLGDPDYIESVKNIIANEMINAETAVGHTCDSFMQMFDSITSAYMRGRGADVKDISERIITILEGRDSHAIKSESPVIIIADDLTPSETAQLDRKNTLAFVTEGGTSNSHTAILARMMNIPAVIDAEGIYSYGLDGKDIIVDGTDGTVYIDPDEETLLKMERKRNDFRRERKSLAQLIGKETVTADGRKIVLHANIGNVFDIENVIANDAEGIGLFRSEFLYLEGGGFPDEEAQFNVYREVLEKMDGKKVIIRTFDIGADKRVGYFREDEGENPAMGIRAVRVYFEHKEWLKTQLRALYRASVYGSLSIMFPMITSVWEIDEIIKIIDDVKYELDSEGIKYVNDVPLGCMVETPAAAVISDDLAKRLDFLSIGTNDLTQYALAADRTNPHIGRYCDYHHKAVLRLIRTVVENAHKNGVKVGVCGELAADPDMTETLLALGVDALSAAPGTLLALRDRIRKIDVSSVKDDILNRILQ